MGTCPVGQEDLEPTTFLDIEVEGCTMCGGILFPKGGLQAVLKRAPALLHRLEDQFQDLRLDKEAIPRKLPCASCGATMRQAEAKQIPGFRPHVCESCAATWVTDGALTVAELFFKAQRAKHAEEAEAAEEAVETADPEKTRADKPPTIECKSCGNVNRAEEEYCLKCDAAMTIHVREGHIENHCPRCQKALYEAPRAGTKILACSDCSGIWLPYAQLTEFMQDGAERLAKLDNDFTVVPHTPGQRQIQRCPTCGADLKDIDYAVATPSGERKPTGVIVHECPTCRGAWFDSGESHDLAVKARPLLTS